jgi:hypothetical protein
VRLLLGGMLLVAAIAAGAVANRALLAFVVGAGVVAFAALADRRGLLIGADVDPDPLPDDVVFESDLRTVARAAYPSTVGVSVLALIALVANQDLLAALLGGAVAGLGVASAVGLVALLAWERRRAVRLYNGERGRRFVG